VGLKSLGIAKLAKEKGRKMKSQIDNIQKMFAFYGWAICPLPRKKIASLLARGKTQEQIYEIGCGVFCVSFPHN